MTRAPSRQYFYSRWVRYPSCFRVGWLIASFVVLPTSSTLARDFYVDPSAGSASGDGSAASPWQTLEAVASAGELGGGGSVQAGDTVYLRSGYHGELSISGGSNATPIVIAAAPDATPTLRRVLLRRTSGWVLRGLSISPSHAPTYEVSTLVDLDGPESANITVEDCELFSVRDSSAWSAADWVANAANGVSVDGPDNVIRRNRLTNVRFGISVSGARVLVSRNVIENFSGDGMRGLGDDGVFEYNEVRNCYDVDDNHDDGFQSWSVGPGGVGTGEVRGLVLRGNLIVNYTDPAQPHRGTLQGIGCFDGFFVDWVVENNVVITDHWHGITLLGARGSRIVNNTVIDPNAERPGPPWISIGNHKDGTPSSDCVVRNNITTDLSIDDAPSVVVDNNLEITGASGLFVDVARHDLHLVPGAMAIDVGSDDLAPAFDRDGIPRPQGAGIDLGAYEWHEPDVLPVDAGGPPVDAAGPPVGDAGLPSGDGGSRLDAAVTDGSARADATQPGSDGGTGTDDGGCGCRATRPRSLRAEGASVLVLGIVIVRSAWRRRRRAPMRARPRA